MGWFAPHTHTHPKAFWNIDARRLCSETGFSLTEVMAAVVVFSLGLIGLGGMQIVTIKLNAAAQITTRMAMVAQEQMEALLSLPFTHEVLQDNDPAVGQGTTRCVLYPPEGIRQCTDKTFTSFYPAPKGRTYCTVTTQSPIGSTCSDTSFPPPTQGYKVQWTVDTVEVNSSGNLLPIEQQLTYVNITVSQTTEGKTQSKKIQSKLYQGKTYMLSFAKLAR